MAGNTKKQHLPEKRHKTQDWTHESRERQFKVRWMLVFYDACIFVGICLLFILFYSRDVQQSGIGNVIVQIALGFVCIFGVRFVSGVYRQVWRYGSIRGYLRILGADLVGGILFGVIECLLPMQPLDFIRVVALVSMDLLGIVAMRMIYYSLYSVTDQNSLLGKICRVLFRIFAGMDIRENSTVQRQGAKIKIAIVGAGRVGVGLAEELLSNPHSIYLPCCFIDNSSEKIGRKLDDIPIYSDHYDIYTLIHDYQIQEIVFALPQLEVQEKKRLYEYYQKTGCRIKVYDYSTTQIAQNGKRRLREFGVEELLFRPAIRIQHSATDAYYRGQVVMITGGGGSIGSELCRQIAQMQPKQLIVVDICENGVYEIQQELKMSYGQMFDVRPEICSICDEKGMEKLFDTYRPNIVLHAAAHKHVPLMEHNCCEAIKNNVFGTLNIIMLTEKYAVGRFILISTDKAVNPTNVMGATKRLCEMLVQSHSKQSTTTVYSATRFGNVLGSAGSVIPLFKRQIASGGPVTVTDKRITRYFMTIPEAAQLVLQSGQMAHNGELFVLDMGKSIKIIELAENMIRLSGLEPNVDIQIIETGLRPGEKLYEELLIKPEELTRTENNMIFIERDTAMPLEKLLCEIEQLREALEVEDDAVAKNALKQVVPTFHDPKEVNEAVLAQSR